MRGIICSAVLFVLVFVGIAGGGERVERLRVDVVSCSVEQRYDEAAPGVESAFAIRFELDKGWHFYASSRTAPGGMNLKISPVEKGSGWLRFGKAVFPEPGTYFDNALGKKLAVFSGAFTVYVPFSVVSDVDFSHGTMRTAVVEIGIKGAVCSDIQCRVPDFGKLVTQVRIVKDAAVGQAKFSLPVARPSQQGQTHASVGTREAPQGYWANYSLWAALVLAFVAGLSLNIMPCVWPVLPIIVMRLVSQAAKGRGRSIAMGAVFCVGILLFFAALAGANIVLQLAYGTVLQWGDQFRQPWFVAGMALLLVVLALFMFGLFTITVPSSISSKSGAGDGYTGAVGMGFLAAILSTPCSFAILAGAFAWAQAQPLGLGTLAIMVIGVGMAVPYIILTAMPALLNKVPKPGRWMELFKQAIGFVLLVIAVKLIAAVPAARRMGLLYYSVVLAFCVWMWGGWVGYTAPAVKRWIVRIIAVALAVAGGFAFLPAPKAELIDWQKYDAAAIKTARAEGRPVLIKFTADWCLSCQVAEKMVFSREDIAKLIKQKGVLAVKADTTVKDYPASKALKEIYKEPGVPVTILFLPGNQPAVRWRGMSFGDELKAELEKL